MQRWTCIYHAEGALAELDHEGCHRARQQLSKALTLHLDDGTVAIDKNLIELLIKPWKLGAKNWLFVGSKLAGQRAALVISLVQSAKLNGLYPRA